jgi:hypothetical protein
MFRAKKILSRGEAIFQRFHKMKRNDLEGKDALLKKFRTQGAQIVRNEESLGVHLNKPAPAKAGEGCSAI